MLLRYLSSAVFIIDTCDSLRNSDQVFRTDSRWTQTGRQPDGLRLKNRHPALLLAHLQRVNYARRALIGDFSGATEAAMKDQQALDAVAGHYRESQPHERRRPGNCSTTAQPVQSMRVGKDKITVKSSLSSVSPIPTDRFNKVPGATSVDPPTMNVPSTRSLPSIALPENLVSS